MVLKGLIVLVQMDCKGSIGFLMLTHVPYDLILTATVRYMRVHVTEMSMNVSKVLIYVIKYYINAFVTQAKVPQCMFFKLSHTCQYIQWQNMQTLQ